MSTVSSFLRTTSLLAATGAIALAATSTDAREIHRGGGYATGKARTGTFNNMVSRDRDNGVATTTRSQNVTTGKGINLNRNATSTYNKETGEFNRVVTGASGQTRTITGTASDGQRTGTYTTGNGQTGSFNNTVSRNEDGSVTKNQAITGANGETRTRALVGKYDKTSNSFTREVTGENGRTRSNTVTMDNAEKDVAE